MGYPSDLTEQEWSLIEHHFQRQDRRGRACKHPRKQIVDAVLYVMRTGAQWRMLPHDFPPWKTVYDHFRRWNQRGVWDAALDQLNAQHRRKRDGRSGSPGSPSVHNALKPAKAMQETLDWRMHRK